MNGSFNHFVIVSLADFNSQDEQGSKIEVVALQGASALFTSSGLTLNEIETIKPD